MGNYINNKLQMSAVPCESAYPASAKLCEEKNSTYTAVPSTTEDGKMILTVAITMTEPKSDAAKAIMADKTTVDGMSWISFANADQTAGESSVFNMTAAGPVQMADASGLWKCATSIAAASKMADDKAWKTCADHACV